MHLAELWMTCFVLLPVRSESYSAMEEYFQIGPYFFQRLLAGFLQYMFDEYQHPGGYSRKVGYIGVERLRAMASILGSKCSSRLSSCWVRGQSLPVGYILYEDGGEVAYKTVVGVQVGSVAASKDKPFTGKETTFGILPQIDGNGIPAALDNACRARTPC